MADQRNVEHLRKVGKRDKADELTGPMPKRRGGGGRKGHMMAGGDTISDHIVSDLPKRVRRSLFDFVRPNWRNR